MIRQLIIVLVSVLLGLVLGLLLADPAPFPFIAGVDFVP